MKKHFLAFLSSVSHNRYKDIPSGPAPCSRDPTQGPVIRSNKALRKYDVWSLRHSSFVEAVIMMMYLTCLHRRREGLCAVIT